jgi:hypothetical protein
MEGMVCTIVHTMHRGSLHFRLPAIFLIGEEKLVAPLIAVPNVDKANRRQEKGKKRKMAGTAVVPAYCKSLKLPEIQAFA